MRLRNLVLGAIVALAAAFVATCDNPNNPDNCIYTLAPASQTVAATGGNFGFVANRNTANGCSYAATTSAPWISITSGDTGQSGNTIGYSVAANISTQARTGTINVGWHGGSATFTVSQAGVAAAPR